MVLTDTLSGIFDGRNLTMGWRSGMEGSIHLRNLFDEGNITHNNIDKRMESLATSMTPVIRTNGVSYSSRNVTVEISQFARGEMWITTTCVYIRWPWIASPAVMIGLTGVFLLLVALENRGIKNDQLWKDSFLAALFCEV
jgi:hypothetical protein